VESNFDPAAFLGAMSDGKPVSTFPDIALAEFPVAREALWRQPSGLRPRADPLTQLLDVAGEAAA
jgi:hypothetical protein